MSGGVFSELARDILNRGGVVYGCALTETFRAMHIRINSIDEIDRLRGSKYIQSDLTNIWTLLAKDIESGIPVLFSGTPCQVAAVRAYVSFKLLSDDNLICVDLVCHGVPSPIVWADYLKCMEQRFDGSVESVVFRDKYRFGWASCHETVFIDGVPHSAETFKDLYFAHQVVRLSCFCCPYKSTKRVGDVSIADFWGIDDVIPGFNDNRGVSLVLINSIKGDGIFARIRPRLDARKVSIEKCLQPSLVTNFPEPKNRAKFWRDFQMHDLEWLVRHYANKPLWRRMGSKIKRRIKNRGGSKC